MNVQRGRPRLDRPKYDLGTPELILKRAQISPQDPTLSSCPIDALLGRKHLTTEEHGAACRFRAYRKIVFGSPSVQAVDLNHVSQGHPDEPNDGHAEREYRAVCAMLRTEGLEVFKTFERIVVHERWPQWMGTGFRNCPDWEAVQFLKAIKIILAWNEGH